MTCGSSQNFAPSDLGDFNFMANSQNEWTLSQTLLLVFMCGPINDQSIHFAHEIGDIWPPPPTQELLNSCGGDQGYKLAILVWLS